MPFFKVAIKTPQVAEAREWCAVVGKEGKDWGMIYDHDPFRGTGAVWFLFRKETDAVEFKLRFE